MLCFAGVGHRQGIELDRASRSQLGQIFLPPLKVKKTACQETGNLTFFITVVETSGLYYKHIFMIVSDDRK